MSRRQGRGREATRGADASEACIASADVVVVSKVFSKQDVKWKLRALGGHQLWHNPVESDEERLVHDD